ncbi:MAG: hypothetical protein ACU83V_05035 [Gammaproteobacteria bacterium]
MKKLILFVVIIFLTGCSQDWFNKLWRKSVEYMDGNYRVTYANGNTEKTWIVRDGKVTTSEKGYYYFWDEHKHYVQTPMENTFVEEF